MHNNIKPCFWGPHFWKSLYSLVAVYPENPDHNTINSTKNLLISWRFILPCEGCRLHFTKFSNEPDTNINDPSNYSSRNKLISLVFKIRNKVNDRLGLDYGITENYFKFKLNKMICNGSNIDSYANSISEAPIIHDKAKDKIFAFLKKNGYDTDITKEFITKFKSFIISPVFNPNNKEFKLFFKRNNKCRSIINEIYNNMACGDYDLDLSLSKDKKLHLELFHLGCSIIDYKIILDKL